MIKEILIQKSIKEIPEEIKKQYKNWEKLHFMKNAYWDMIAKNCFYIENKFVFFDPRMGKIIFASRIYNISFSNKFI